MVEYHRKEKNKTFSDHLADFCIDQRVWVFAALTLVTVVLGWYAFQLPIAGQASDLIPIHPWMDVHNEYKESFGGSNMVAILVEVDEDAEGTILRMPILKGIQTITQDLRKVEAVNPGSITSLASSKLRTIKATTIRIQSEPLMWPDLPENQQKIDELRENIRESPTAYGTYVARDYRAALITVDFYDRLLEPIKASRQIRELRNRVLSEVRRDIPGVNIRLVGQPVLAGWIYWYIIETVVLLFATMILEAILRPILSRRTLFQSLLPLGCATIGALWAFGIAELLGLDFNPLVVVIALLIAARSVSASVQSLMRFDREIRKGADTAVEAARITLGAKWTPGVLAMLTDAGAVLIVAISPVPVLQKAAYVSFVWLLTVPFTSIVLTPVALSWVPDIHRESVWKNVNRSLDWMGEWCAKLSTGTAASWVLVGLAVTLLVCGYYAVNVPIGDANPGTPILWADSKFNRAAAAITRHFPGSNQMFTVVEGDTFVDERPVQNPVLEPEVVATVRDFQRFSERSPGIGRTVSFVDVITQMNRNLNEGDPRYARIARSKDINGELLYFFLQGASASDFARFMNQQRSIASVRMFFRDQQGETIREAFSRIQHFIQHHPMKHADLKLAGGLVGVIAATNDIIREDQLEHIGLAFLLVIFLCGLTYRGREAGMYLMMPILLANVITFSYMYARGIGLNINSLPVAALGIGLGIDKGIYVTDRIKHALPETGDLREAIFITMETAGRSVIVTDIGLIIALLPWYFFSHLRFQAEMAILINIWMFVASAGALLIMPSLVWVFRPSFVMRALEGDESAD